MFPLSLSFPFPVDVPGSSSELERVMGSGSLIVVNSVVFLCLRSSRYSVSMSFCSCLSAYLEFLVSLSNKTHFLSVFFFQTRPRATVESKKVFSLVTSIESAVMTRYLN